MMKGMKSYFKLIDITNKNNKKFKKKWNFSNSKLNIIKIFKDI